MSSGHELRRLEGRPPDGKALMSCPMSVIGLLCQWLMATQYEWDSVKERANVKKHGVSFAEAKAVLESADDCLEIFDEAHSADEDRFITIGPGPGGLLVVVWVERSETSIRIISARQATTAERIFYQKYIEEHR
jgi:uncharacterized protein